MIVRIIMKSGKVCSVVCRGSSNSCFGLKLENSWTVFIDELLVVRFQRFDIG